MDHHEGELPADDALQTRSGQSEEVLAQMRDDLRDAIRAQEQLQVQLREAVEELSEALTHQRRPTALERTDPQLQLLEARIRGVEQRVDRTAEQLKGILQSRIWRTLVGAGGFLLRLRHRK
jgi:ATP phosphoribosyltransferase